MARPLATEGSNIMGKTIHLLVGKPTITGAKIGKYGEVRIQADEGPGGNSEGEPHGISVHYCIESEQAEPPRVREKLLVAVVEGVYPQWLDSWPGGDMVDITYEADSSNNNDRVVKLQTCPIGDTSRLLLQTWVRPHYGRADRADVILAKGQVASLITALLALYPRLHEADDS